MSSDPRRVPQGTSYDSGGLLDPPKTDLEIGSARAGILREVVPELGSQRQRIQIFDKMVNSDAAVDVSLRGAKAIPLGAEYFLEPFSNDNVDLEVNEFCYHNIFERLTTPILMVLEDAYRMFDYGSSVLEDVYEKGEWAPKRSGANRKNYTMLRKLAPRPASTIKKINYDDNGGPISVTHIAMGADNRPNEVEIPIEKLLIFTANRQGGNLEGKSYLRTAFPHWVYKQKLYKIDAIQKERHGIGVPKIKLQPGYTEADKIAAHELGANLRTNERGHMVLPPNIDVDFAELHGNPVDVLKSVEHHNAMIMMNVMLEFLLAGIDSGGGRATSASQLDMFIKASKTHADLVCAVFNQYLIPKLVGYNYKVLGFPKMKARKIGDTKNAQQFAAALANLAARGLITMDDELENWVREQFDMPKFQGTLSVEERMTRLAKAANPFMPGQGASQNGSGNKGDVVQPNKPGNQGADTQSA